MPLSPDEIKRIEEEELLRFKTRRTLEVCETYTVRDRQIAYRNPDIAFSILCFESGLLCAILLIIFFPEEVLRWIFPAIVAFNAGFFVCAIWMEHKKAERTFWGWPRNVPSPMDRLWYGILTSSILMLGPIVWTRGKGHDNFVPVFAVLDAVYGALLVVSFLNVHYPKGRKVAAERPRVEDAFSELRKGQEAAYKSTGSSDEKSASATPRLNPREG